MELGPFSVMETPASRQTALWVQGGFPKSFLNSEGQSMFWRDHFIRTYLERDVPTLGPRIPATTLRNFWTMLAHNQGGVFNASELARSLDVDGKTVVRYLDVLTDLMLVRRLQPYFVNVGKPLVKVPRVFVRDSGIVHALLQVKLGETSRPERGFYQAAKDIRADRRFLVNPGTSPGGYANPEVELMGMRKMAALLAAMERKPGAPAGESRRAGR